MNETFFRELSDHTAHDLAGGPSDWYGVVVNPTSPDAVPLVRSAAFGLLPSLTYVRMLIDADVCAHFAYENETAHPDERPLRQNEDTFYFADEVHRAVLDAPPHTVAALAVAVQVLAVQMGREWSARGFDAGTLSTVWFDAAGAETKPALTWVSERWARDPVAADAFLDPTRMLGRNLHRTTADLTSLRAATVRVAVAAFATREHRFRCLVDPTAPTPRGSTRPQRIRRR